MTARLELAAGIVLIGVGVAAMLTSSLGAGPFDLMMVGLVATLGWSFFAAGLLAQASVAVAAVAFGRRPAVAPTVAMLALGAVVDGALPLWRQAADVTGAAGTFAAGATMLCVGVAVYISAGAGEAPVEAAMVALERRWGWSRARARMTIDAVCLAAGLLLGATAGIGTALLLAGTGPGVQVATRLYGRLRRPAAVECPAA